MFFKCVVDIFLSCYIVCQCQIINGILEYFKGYYLLILQFRVNYLINACLWKYFLIGNCVVIKLFEIVEVLVEFVGKFIL